MSIFYIIIVLKAYSIAVLKIRRIVIICWICRKIAGNSRLPPESASNEGHVRAHDCHV